MMGRKKRKAAGPSEDVGMTNNRPRTTGAIIGLLKVFKIAAALNRYVLPSLAMGFAEKFDSVRPERCLEVALKPLRLIISDLRYQDSMCFATYSGFRYYYLLPLFSK